MGSNTKYTRLIEITVRWYVSAMMGLYAVGKIANGQFYHQGNLPPEVAQKTVEQLSAFELAWTFFGYSRAYILFIGLSQLVGAILLLWERSKLSGVAILLPILANIIVVDAEFGVGDAIVSAILYFSMLLLILFFNRKKVLKILQIMTAKEPEFQSAKPGMLLRFTMIAGILVAVFFLETLLLKMVGFNRF